MERNPRTDRTTQPFPPLAESAEPSKTTVSLLAVEIAVVLMDIAHARGGTASVPNTAHGILTELAIAYRERNELRATVEQQAAAWNADKDRLNHAHQEAESALQEAKEITARFKSAFKALRAFMHVLQSYFRGPRVDGDAETVQSEWKNLTHTLVELGIARLVSREEAIPDPAATENDLSGETDGEAYHAMEATPSGPHISIEEAPPEEGLPTVMIDTSLLSD